MIKSKQDYHYYLKEDERALNKGNMSYVSRIKRFVFPDYTYIFQKYLRRVEYFKNCTPSFCNSIRYLFILYKFKRLSLKLGFSIPPNVFGPGLSIVHYGTIVINPNTIIGKNCRIHVCTNIGASGGSVKAPKIGDNVYIGPGAKIYGDIKIASNVAIAANAVVAKSFLEENVMIGGVPAKMIKKINISDIIEHLGNDCHHTSIDEKGF